MKLVLSKLLAAVSYIGIWIIIYFGIVQIFSDSPSRVAYGLLSSWWAALCFSLVIEIKIEDLALIMPLVAFISFLGSIFSKRLSSFLSDIDEFLLFLSPMILSSFIYLIKSNIRLIETKEKSRLILLRNMKVLINDDGSAEYNGLGEGMRDYIYLGDRLLAEYQAQTGQIYYYTSDQVNSTRVMTDQNGVRVFAATYDPYGGIQKIWENSYSPAMKFSGKERDTESNLDYFRARYYGNYYYRWLSPDPVINKDAALTNPQLWNLYAFCHNNPVTYWDPDGMDVFYATEQLRLFFGVLAARSQKVRDTLALYEGEGRPNLHIEQGDAGIDIEGEKAYGSFAADIIPDYGENLTKLTPGMTLEEMENLATWSVREATLILDTNLTISIFNRDTIRHALHELGHADQAARSPLQYRRDINNIRDKEGKIMKHDKRPNEIYADRYEERAYERIAK